MNLQLSPAHEAFRAGIRNFLVARRDKAATLASGSWPGPAQLAWQTLTLEHGYAGRTVPREYGGYGATLDVMEAQLTIEEGGRAGVRAGLGNQGISMLVPTLFEFGTEQQKRESIAPTLRGELVWCQG